MVSRPHPYNASFTSDPVLKSERGSEEVLSTVRRLYSLAGYEARARRDSEIGSAGFARDAQ
jgi:hypothetical protein